MNQLLKIAKEQGEREWREVTKDEVEVIVAYLHREVGLKGVSAALELKHNSQVTHLMPRIIREGINNGWLRVELKE
jgi:site-specific recombinase XerC